MRHVLDDVFELQDVIGRVGQGVEAVVDLGLAGGAHLVVRPLHLQARLDQRLGHLVAQVGVMVVRAHWEVAALDPGLVTEVAALLDPAGVPGAFDRVDLVGRAVDGGGVADVVEDVELGLRAEVGGVGDAGARQVLLGLGRHPTRIALVRLAGTWLDDGEVQVQRLGGPERIQVGGRGIGQQLQVRLVDRREATDRRAVEEQPLGERVGGEAAGRNVEVLLDTGQVGEPDIDEFDALVGDEAENLVGATEHRRSFGCLVGGGASLHMR